MQKIVIKEIFLDLDGVFVDFDEMFKTVIGVYPENTNRDDHHKNFVKFVNAGGFLNAPKVKNASEFFREIYTIAEENDIRLRFLTSDGSMREVRDEVLRQKKEWLQNNGMWLGESNFILSLGWRGKADYATKHSLLIDDTPKNVDYFESRGGHGLVYNEKNHAKICEVIKDVITKQ